MAEAGTGMLHIARALNDEGIASPAGKLWSKNGIHFILRNEVYTGTLIWGANAKDKADPIRIEKAFPAIISKAKSQRVNRLMRSRAPKIAHPRRVGSTYLLSGLVKCHKCNRALSGQDAKSGQFSYYVCQSIMKRGKDACDTPRLNARRFEEMVVGKIRSNVLTEGNIRALVKVVDEQMDGVAREQRKRLETIEDELEDVKRKLGRIWHFVETTDINMADASDRICLPSKMVGIDQLNQWQAANHISAPPVAKSAYPIVVHLPALTPAQCGETTKGITAPSMPSRFQYGEPALRVRPVQPYRSLRPLRSTDASPRIASMSTSPVAMRPINQITKPTITPRAANSNTSRASPAPCQTQTTPKRNPARRPIVIALTMVS